MDSITKNRIKAIISELSENSIEDVKDEALLYDHLGIDSLDAVEIILEIEKEFDVSIPDEDVFQAKTVSDLITGLSKSITK